MLNKEEREKFNNIKNSIEESKLLSRPMAFNIIPISILDLIWLVSKFEESQEELERVRDVLDDVQGDYADLQLKYDQLRGTA